MQMKIHARKDKYARRAPLGEMKAHYRAAAAEQRHQDGPSGVESEHAKHPVYQENIGPQSDVSMHATSYQDDNSATPQKNMGLTPPATQSTTYSTKTIEPKSKKKIDPTYLGPNQTIPPSLADADKEKQNK